MRTRRAGELLLLSAVIVLAAWTRVANYRVALVGGEVIPQVDGDSSYHLHRSLETVRDFPRVPHFDPEMNWPKGAFIPWADGFDLGGAALAILSGGRGDLDRSRLAIALWPVLLGVLLVVAVVRLARTATPGAPGRGPALAAGLVAALMPGAVVNSALGRMDHHVFEMLLMVLLATWALRRLPPAPGRATPGALGFELEGVFLSGLGIYGFTGSPLYVGVAVVPLAFAAWREGRIWGSGAAGLLGGAALAAALSVPAMLDHRQVLSFKYPSFLQPLLVALAGIGLAACAWVGVVDRVRRRSRARWLLVGVLACLLACAPFLPRIFREISEGSIGWLLHRDPWLNQIWEFLPYLGVPGETSPWLRISAEFAWPGYLLPVAFVLIAWKARGPRARWLLYTAAALVVLTLVQNRFSRVLAPFVAVLTASSIGLGTRALSRRWRVARSVWAAPAVAGALLFLDASPRVFLRPLPAARRMEPIFQAALDLRERPPARESRGTLSNWGYGHHLEALGGVPVVVNGFGSYLDAPEFWKADSAFGGTAAELDAYMKEHRIGLVVAGVATLRYQAVANGAPGFVGGRLNEEFMKSLPLSPLLIAGSAVPGWGIPHLEHLMPRFASRSRVADLGFSLPFVWTYEVVAGARLRGRTAPGLRVLAELLFREQGQPHVYRAWTRAGTDGRWELVLPFPSGYWTPTVAAPGPWAVGAEGSNPVAVSVPEVAVREGRDLEVGVLPAPPPPGSVRAPSSPVLQ